MLGGRRTMPRTGPGRRILPHSRRKLCSVLDGSGRTESGADAHNDATITRHGPTQHKASRSIGRWETGPGLSTARGWPPSRCQKRCESGPRLLGADTRAPWPSGHFEPTLKASKRHEAPRSAGVSKSSRPIRELKPHLSKLRLPPEEVPDCRAATGAQELCLRGNRTEPRLIGGLACALRRSRAAAA